MMSQRISRVQKTFDESVRCSLLGNSIFLEYDCPVQHSIGEFVATLRDKTQAT
jgi:hypothetical protein